MSEVLTSAQFELDAFVPSDRYESPRYGYVAEHGLIHTANGDLSVFITPHDKQLHRLDIDEGSSYDFGELMSLRSSISMGLDNGKFGADFLRTLGYDYILDKQDGGRPKIVSVAPTAEYLNSALQLIYAEEDQEPPLSFSAKSTERGHATGKEFIEGLAEGRVMISAPIQGEIFEFTHDHKYHIPGYASLDTRTASAIKKRAQQLIDRGKLTTNEIIGDLIDEDARSFAEGVERLTPYINHDLSSDRDNPKGELRNRLAKSMPKIRIPLIRAVVLEKTRIGLAEHQQWLAERSSELQLAA